MAAETAEKAVTIVTDRPLLGQLADRARRAHARRAALAAELAGLALDVELGDATALERERELLPALDKAASECSRVERAMTQAHQRDGARQAEVDIIRLEEELAVYRRICEARTTAFRDLAVHAAASDQALNRLRSALMLMEKGALPEGTALPRGYRINAKAQSIDEIERENRFLVDLLERQIAGIAAIKRNPPDDVESAA